MCCFSYLYWPKPSFHLYLPSRDYWRWPKRVQAKYERLPSNEFSELSVGAFQSKRVNAKEMMIVPKTRLVSTTHVKIHATNSINHVGPMQNAMLSHTGQYVLVPLDGQAVLMKDASNVSNTF
jgi:hypothetical protein